jgi:tyrosine-protein phosphatase YwqE
MPPLFHWFGKPRSESKLNISDWAVDMHSHLIPGIDDGSRSMDETLAMLLKFQELGYQKVITTPHIMNEVYPNTEADILRKGQEMMEEMHKAGVSIEIAVAAEYYFDDSLLKKTKEKNLLTIGKEYVLTEFSFYSEPTHEKKLFFDMQMAGYKPILAHFERYAYYHGSVDYALELRELGVHIQANVNSFFGHYGSTIKKQAVSLLKAKAIDFIGTDCHRIQHLTLLEDHLHFSDADLLNALDLKNNHLL